MHSNKGLNALAIDGPAGSGKSTISRKVAGRLGYVYIDTGAMYRALTLKVMNEGISFDDAEAISSVSDGLDILLNPSGDEKTTIQVILDGNDVSEEIRTLDVTGNVKYVAKIPEVRKNLVALQRKMACSLAGSVMEGRDITTVVLPDAKFKVYLDASLEERVDRRFNEFKAKGKEVSREDVKKDLDERDHADFTREVGPLKKSEDAFILDTSGLSIDQVVEKIIGYVKGQEEPGQHE